MLDPDNIITLETDAEGANSTPTSYWQRQLGRNAVAYRKH